MKIFTFFILIWLINLSHFHRSPFVSEYLHCISWYYLIRRSDEIFYSVEWDFQISSWFFGDPLLSDISITSLWHVWTIGHEKSRKEVGKYRTRNHKYNRMKYLKLYISRKIHIGSCHCSGERQGESIECGCEELYNDESYDKPHPKKKYIRHKIIIN